MVEINEAERRKEKRMRRMRTLRDLWDNVKHPNIRIRGVSEEEDKKKDHEKTLEEIIVENFPKMGKEIITQVVLEWVAIAFSPRNPESPKQEKHKVKHPKTHINQINKDQTQRTNIKSSKGKTTNNTQGDSHKDNSRSFNKNSSGQEGMAGHT